MFSPIRKPATIGFPEKKAAEKGIAYLSAKYPFNDHGKSILMEANYGYVKVLAEPKRGRILGAEIVGKDAGELIHCPRRSASDCAYHRCAGLRF